MAKIKRKLKAARDAAQGEVATLASEVMYARGMASDGFAGGYLQALDDVLLALNGVDPDRWRKWRERELARRILRS